MAYITWNEADSTSKEEREEGLCNFWAGLKESGLLCSKERNRWGKRNEEITQMPVLAQSYISPLICSVYVVN